MTYPSEVKAQALSLAIQGKTRWRIAKELGIDNHTVGTWLANAPEIPLEQQKHIMQNAVDKALLADEMVLEAMEYIKEQAQEDKSILVKHMAQLTITGGVAVDKIVAFQKQPQAISIDKAIIVIERQQ